MLTTVIKFRDIGYIIVILGLVVWGQGLSLKVSGWHLKIANARIEAQERADKLANELIIQEAIAMGVTNQKAQDYGTQIKKATSDRQRDAIGTRGVRDIVSDKPSP